MAPAISVVIPVGDERADAANVATWTLGQEVDPDLHEVVVVAGRDVADLDAYRAVLRPGDQLLAGHGDRFEGYTAGIDAARGAVILLAEDHSLARPGCIAAVAEAFADGTRQAATLRYGHVNRTVVAEAEALVYESTREDWERPGHWDRVRLRGFAIRRSCLEEVGGMDHAYGLFAEALLAMRLHRHAVEIGCVDDAAVDHVNTLRLAETIAAINDYVDGQIAFLRGPARLEAVDYFPPSVVLLRSRVLPPRIAARMARAATATARSGAIGWGAAATAVAGSVGRSTATRVGADVAVAAAAARSLVAGRDRSRRQRACRDLWDRWGERQRIRRAHGAGAAPPPNTADAYEGPRLAALHGLGLHDAEVHGGRSLLWTAPLALLPWRTLGGERELLIDTGGLRGPAADLRVGLCWDGRPVPTRVGRHGPGVLAAPITGGAGVHELVIVVAPADTSGTGERRPLGLPVTAIRLAR